MDEFVVVAVFTNRKEAAAFTADDDPDIDACALAIESLTWRQLERAILKSAIGKLFEPLTKLVGRP